ncbi:MAG: hypothetical protein Q8R24_03420 [Legionellaceae bacterium]|nr:hypothetical protein [Legionellaceae bacterium]
MVNLKVPFLINNVEEAKQALLMGIQGKLQLYIINHNNGFAQLLTQGELEKIRSSIPNKVNIVSRSAKSELPPLQGVSYLDLWVEKANYEGIFLKTPKIISEVVKAYLTPQIELMHAAINQFWLNYDPSHPPKKEAIVDWLVEKGATTRVANAIDTIIRPTSYKSGGNRRIEKRN